MQGLSEQRLPKGCSVIEWTEMRLEGHGDVKRGLPRPASGSGLPLAVHDSPLKRKVDGQGEGWGWEPGGNKLLF